ncbi:hypothetical protein LF1_06840 [Rubripirellula obstinata]|uniref:UPF0310 protein LF1_06840 n=1 Tax=Rubripirellula obstinata TaxID=406547 RepID=A0A5B1CEI3_9BACT|nr:EVE domain-containing protein [Rubripirellula obstinata]KAA1258169.1 hypothetical protein LF1_06840 [Rubripirellula obstinata]
MIKFWIGVAVLDHIESAVAGGFVQLGHGKEAPVRRLSDGDGIILYATRQSLEGGDSVSSFAAVGRVVGDEVKQVRQSDCFEPFRRDVQYDDNVSPVAVRPLLELLSFTRGKGNHWGMAFRRGSFAIPQDDFDLIRDAMKDAYRGKH